MQITRHFLGWDGPVVEKVGNWLVAGKTSAVPIDFHDTLILAPTLQAGRRLREVLATLCHERQSVLLSAMIVTPHYFFSRYRPGIKTANPALTKAVWAEILEKADLAKFSVFLPKPDMLRNIDKSPWALATGETIERLRQELADGGYGIPDLIEKHAKDLQELDRWQDLASLEKLYLQELSKLGFSDSCRVKIGMAGRPELEPGVKRIVMACVPDPTLLAVRALQNLARDYAVDILIHAPANMDTSFDEWGRPVAEFWAGAEVEIPDWESNVFLESAPDTQAERAVEILAGLPAKYGPADIGMGVPDPAALPFLEKGLRAAGLPAFDPSDAPFREHTLGRLVASMFNILQSRAYVHVADLLRHPDFLRYIEEVHKVEPCLALTQLDEFQNHYLPVSLESMLAPFAVLQSECSGKNDDFSTLAKALAIIKGHVDTFDSRPLEEAWRIFLQSVYGVRLIRQDVAGDMEFRQAAGIVEDTFRELRQFPEKKLELERSRLLNIFFRRLQEQTYSRERNGEVLDLQGWLELPWTDTSILVITGLNEEFVPGGSLGGMFLPDSLRKILKLRDDLSRFGRDVYLLKAMIESRRRDGRLFIIAGKYTLSGDPLRPSRLLFRCRDKELPARARKLFQPIEQAERARAAETIFRLKPAEGEKDGKILEQKRISVTAFRDYIACPFRFFLKHILMMETLSDDKNELDALDFGLLVHEVLQAMGADRGLWACPDADRLGRKLVELADRTAAARYGKIIPPAALIALSSARARLQALAREQVTLTQAGWEIVAVEQKKAIARKGFFIHGKIDRVDRHRQSGCIRIIDYKTSDKAESPQAEHLARRREEDAEYNRLVVRGRTDLKGDAKTVEKKWINLQLPLYHLLYDESRVFDAGIGLAYFNLPKAIGETLLTPWDEFNNEMLASAIRCVEGVLDAIAGRIFWPPAKGNGYTDDFAMLFLDAPEKAFDITGFPS